MGLVVKLVKIQKSKEKRVNFSFSNEEGISLDDSGNSEQIVLGDSHSQNEAEEDAPTWRERVHTVSGRNLLALKNSILTDITLEVGPEKTQFLAHKLILSLGSPVFEAMFYGPLAEQGDKVVIPDIMPDGFKVLLKYLYGDFTLLNNEMEALKAWIAADKYCVSKLKKDCYDFLCNYPISSSNIWMLLENAVFLNFLPLISNCKEYLEKHTESSLRGEGFLDTKTETVRHVLNIASADVSELVLLKSVIHWGRYKVDTGEAVSLAAALNPLLPYIHFGALTPEEFCQFLDETKDVLEISDALAILKHLTQPLTYSLPAWCCVSHWPRLCRSPPDSCFYIHGTNQVFQPKKKLKKQNCPPRYS